MPIKGHLLLDLLKGCRLWPLRELIEFVNWNINLLICVLFLFSVANVLHSFYFFCSVFVTF